MLWRTHTGAALKLCLLLLFIWLTNFLWFERIFELSARGNHLAILVFLLIWSISLPSLIVAAFLPRLWMRLLWAVPIALSTLAGVLLFELSGSQLTLYDVLLYWTERTHGTQALRSYGAQVLGPIAKTCLGLVAFLMPVPPWSQGLRRFAWVPSLPFLVMVALLHVSGGKGSASLPEQFNAAAMSVTLFMPGFLGELASERTEVSIAPQVDKPRRHLVLIVDESIRGDFIDLNVDRGTTPYVKSLKSRLANFGLATAGNNCSLFAHLILRLGGDPEDLGGSLRTNPWIWRYAKNAGFRTIYLDAQESNGRLQNGMTLTERSWIDEFQQFGAEHEVERDSALAREMRRILARDESQFIYVVKAGAHFAYENDYPPSEARFHPHMDDDEPIGESRERLINSYANAIGWRVDRFFKDLLAEMPLDDVVIVYTADHGQNLMDRGLIPHCNSTDPHPYEGLVPLFVLTDDRSLRARFQQAARDYRDRATHFQIFPTLLTLMGYGGKASYDLHGPSLLDAPSEDPNGFTYGPVITFRGREIRWRQIPESSLAALAEDPELPRSP